MPATKPRTPTAKAQRREDLLGVSAKLLGCTALIAMVASVFYVAISRLWETPSMEDQWIESAQASASTVEPYVRSAAAEPIVPTLPAPPAPAVDSVPKAIPFSPHSTPTSLSAVQPGIPTSDSGIVTIDAKRPQIEQAVRSFFSATSIDQKAAWSREPSRVRVLMEDYYQRHQIPQFEWKELGKVVPIDEKGYRLGYVQAVFANDDSVSVIVEELEDGTIRVDWESSVRYGEMSWRQFLDERPSEPKILRVIASRPTDERSDPYTHLERLELRDPAEPGTIIAGFERDNPQFAGLLDQLESGKWQNVPLTLRLAFNSTANSRTPVKIAGVEGKGWLILKNNRS